VGGIQYASDVVKDSTVTSRQTVQYRLAVTYLLIIRHVASCQPTTTQYGTVQSSRIPFFTLPASDSE
jgi:hypothetical protein